MAHLEVHPDIAYAKTLSTDFYLSAAYFEEAKEFFGLGTEDRLIGFFHVGMPKGPTPPGRRKPIHSKVVWIK